MNNLKPTLILATFVLIFISGLTPLTAQTSETLIGYDKASYENFTEGQFLKHWLLLGPVKISDADNTPSEAEQKQAFDKDELLSVKIKSNKPLPKVVLNNKEYTWSSKTIENGIVDFNSLYGVTNYAYAYALAEIKVKTDTKILIGIGSDDGVKLYLNGKLIHSKWIGRALTPDEDLVYINLKKGSNQLLVKVQNMQYGWSFCIRKPDKKQFGTLFINSAANGDLDNVKFLLDNGVDINSVNEIGFTACQMAQIKGRTKVLELLKSHGAQTDKKLPPLSQFVDGIFKNAETGNNPGAAVLIGQNGKILYKKGYGYADVGNKVKISPQTKFRIGSITKQFIASAILKFQEEGKLKVTDKLSKYLPDFPKADSVTIHHLLTHTSGIHSYTNRPYFMKYVFAPISPDALVDTIKAYPYDFKPGEKYMYNNSGYFLLGYLAEKISGQKLNEYLDETFFKPLGMKNTGIYNSADLLNNEAYGFSVENNKVSKALNWNMTWAGGAGAIYSTVEDLFIWNEALFNGKVLSDESRKAAFASAKLNNNQETGYGYGWAIFQYRGQKFIAHSGGLHGFVSFLAREPKTNTTITVLCNSTPPPEGISPRENSTFIADYVLMNTLDKQTSFSVENDIDEKTLDSYVGKYDYGNNAILTVTREGKQLFAQMTGQAKFPIYSSSSNKFVWKIVKASATFIADDNGKVTHLIHEQNGQQIEAKKLEE